MSGVEIVEAPNGKVAMERLKERDVDIVFLDLMMPEMDGLTFLSLKREDSKISAIPGVRHANVEIVWDPPWGPSKMSDSAKLQLGML